MRFILLMLVALMASVSTATITLPLFSRAVEVAAKRKIRLQWPEGPAHPNGTSVHLPLTDWVSPRGSDQQWYTSFSIGTPPQELTVYLKTGTPLFILPQSNCTRGCDHMTLFDPSKSTTFSPLPGTAMNTTWNTGITSIPSASREPFNCTFVQDTVSLAFGAFKVHNQSFALCDAYPPLMGEGNSTTSGIMGLGVVGPSAQTTPWFWNLVDSGRLRSSLFSFYIPPLSLAGGQITLGGIDNSKYAGRLRFTNLSADASPDISSYLLDLSAVYANGVMLDANLTSDDQPPYTGYALLDTGTPFLQAPDYDTAKDLYSQISPEITQLTPGGAWGAPCGHIETIAPDLTFSLGNSAQSLNVTIPKKYFTLGEYPGLPDICQTIINSPASGNELSLNLKGVWIAGSPLLDKYYTIWDGLNMQIGWGQIPGMPGFSEYLDH